MARAALGPRGERSTLVHRFRSEIVRFIQPKDYLGEILAIRNAFVQPSAETGQPRVRYTNDPRHVEWVADPEALVSEIATRGAVTCDCDESSCLAATLFLQLGREVQFVALGFGEGTQFTHVGVRVKEPKSGKWVWVDTVAGPREREAAATARRAIFYDLD